MGIRDGDPAVLQALVNRRGAAVLAYCERVCAPSLALDAAADAFVRFRAQVLAADRPGDINPEVALLSATRHAAASRAPRPPAKGGAGGLGRLLGGKAPAERLTDVPDLLAARADGAISPEDDQALEALLDSSPVARAIEERFVAAETAYSTAPRQALAEPLTDQIVATMAALAAAPTNGGPAPAAVEHVPVPEPEPLPPAPRFFHTEPAPPPPAPEVPADDPFAAEGVSDPFAAELEDESVAPEPEREAPGLFASTAEPQDAEPDDEELVADDSVPELAEEELAPIDDGATVEFQADEAVDVDAAVPDSAEIAATRGEDVDPAGTVEWSVPADELGESPELEHEIAAARLPGEGNDEDPGHLQSASGAVAEDDVSPPPPPVKAPAPAAGQHRPHLPHHLPGRAALAPAAAVVAIAAIGAMAASGVFGGNDPSPAVDTGIVPERALQAVPEGEANAIIDDLRAASADARRRRLADQRQQQAAQQATPDPVEGTTTTPDEGTATPEEEPPATTGETSAPEATGGTSTGGGTASP